MSLHRLTCWKGPTWAYTVVYSALASARRKEGQVSEGLWWMRRVGIPA